MAATLGLALVTFFNRVLLTKDAVIPFDIEGWHFPQQAFLVDQLAQGHLPLWTPLVYSGMPFAANMQAAVFYPVNLAYMFIIAHIVGHLPYRALETFEILHFFVAGLGAYALGRHFGMGRLAGIGCGCVFMLGPYLVSQTEHLGLIEATAWVPLVTLFTHRAMTRGTAIDAVVAGATLSFCFLAGFFAAVIPIGLWLAMYCAQAVARSAGRPSERPYPRPMTTSLILAGIAIGLCAVQVLPTAELAGLSIVNARDFTPVGQPLAYLVTLILPGFFDPGSLETYWGGSDITQGYLYFGLLPLLLIPLGLRTAGVGRGLTLAGTITLGLLIGLGATTAVVYLLLEILPAVVSNGAYGFTFRIFVDLPVALLVGFALDASCRTRLPPPFTSSVRAETWATAGISLILAAIFVMSYGVLVAQGSVAPGSAPGLIANRLNAVLTDVLIQSLVLAWAVGSLRLSRIHPGSLTAGILLLAAVVVPLIIAGSGKAMNTANRGSASVGAVLPGAIVYLKQAGGSVVSPIRYDRSDGGAKAWGSMSQFWGIQFGNGNDPFLLREYQEYRRAFVIAPQPTRTLAQADYQSPLTDLLGVDYVVIGPGNANLTTLQDPGHWKLMLRDPLGDVYQNLRAVPRAFVVGAARTVPLDATLSALRSDQFDPYQQVLVAPDASGDVGQTAPVASAPRRGASYHSVNSDLVEVNVESGAPGWLVVTDVNYPGWVARIDGVETPIRRADYLFRSVYVDGKSHNVAFSFEPRSIRFGLLITGLTWLAVIGVAIASRRKFIALLRSGSH